MDGYYTVSEYARITGKDSGNIRRNLINGLIPGQKFGKQWAIPKDAIYPNDQRVKTGEYRNWRKKIAAWRDNAQLMKSIAGLCSDLGKIYGNTLDRIILYGSYARGEASEESDVDIALILRQHETEKKHLAMIDIVVDYELECGKTLSVITVDKCQYSEWSQILPFYMNMDREGIVIWKTA